MSGGRNGNGANATRVAGRGEKPGTLTHHDVLSQYVVLTAVDQNYLSIFDLWLESFASSGFLPCLRVLTYGRRAARLVERRGLQSLRVEEDVRHPRQIYVSRLAEIEKLVRSGVNVIHTDADAFWVRPDLPSLIDPEIDLQISVGHGTPHEADEQWGFTLCCGLFILHASARMNEFLPIWMQRTVELSDDQRALNELFLKHGIVWTTGSTGRTIGHSGTFDLSVEAISSEVVSRAAVAEGVQIFHPYLGRGSELGKLLRLFPQLDARRARVISRQARTLLSPKIWKTLILQSPDICKRLIPRGVRRTALRGRARGKA